MDNADEVQLDDGRTVQVKEMGNGCYVEVWDDGERQSGQYLLKPKPVVGAMHVLPISSDTKLRLGHLLSNAQEWLDDDSLSESAGTDNSNCELSDDDESRSDSTGTDNSDSELSDDGPGAEKDWFDDTTRADKLLKYVSDNWRDDDPGVLADVAIELAQEDVMLCNRTKKLFTLGEWSAPTGSYVATVASDEANRCPRCGAPKEEYWECIRSSRRTRVPNKYQCQNCGKTRSGITTG